MTWIVADEDEDEFLKQLHSHSDRVAALLGQTILDRRLVAAIKAHWRNTGDVFDTLFQESGPIGSFSTRVKIGFAIGLYGKLAYSDLRRINKIRNAFAHKLEARDFNTQNIRDQANALALPTIYPISKDPVVVKYEGQFIWELCLDTVKHSFLPEEPTDPRGRFLRCVELLTAFLWYEDYFARSAGTPSGVLPTRPRF